MENNTQLITVTQLPVIEQQLSLIKAELEEKAKAALSLVCSPETVKEVKAMRAEINRDFADLEMRRKAAKAQVLRPYEDFEAIYKQYVTEPYKLVDGALRGKVESVECELKGKREKELRAYFDELCSVEGIDFVQFEDARVNVTLSASMKMMREKIQAFVTRVREDVAIIGAYEHPTEALDEYQHNGFNLYAALETVKRRKARILELEKQRAEQAPAVDDAVDDAVDKVVDKVVDEVVDEAASHFSAPVVIDEKEYTVAFTVTATKAKLVELKKFLNDGGYRYDN